MSRTYCLLLAAAAMAFAGAAYGSTPQDWYSTGVYDESANWGNAVDIEATGNTKSLATFKTDVAAAYDGNYGGVCGWDFAVDKNGQYGMGGGTSGRAGNYVAALAPGGYVTRPVSIFYGKDWSKVGAAAGQAEFAPLDYVNGKRIQLDFWDMMDFWPQADSPDGQTVGVPISGNIWSGLSSTPTVMTGRGGTMGATTSTGWSDQVPGQNTKAGVFFHREYDPAYPNVATWASQIKELGFTALCRRQESQDWEVWVVYSDGTSSAHRSQTIGQYSAPLTPDQDTFFHFAAPTGKYISELWWNSPQTRPQIDDLGFILENNPAHITATPGPGARAWGTVHVGLTPSETKTISLLSDGTVAANVTSVAFATGTMFEIDPAYNPGTPNLPVDATAVYGVRFKGSALFGQTFTDTFTITTDAGTFEYALTATTAGPHMGDANSDGKVSLEDFSLLKAYYNQTGQGWDHGNFNGPANNSIINLEDFSLLKAHYSHSGDDMDSPLVTVPEPATMSLIVLGALAVLRKKSR